jgi:hypothetical protein
MQIFAVLFFQLSNVDKHISASNEINQNYKVKRIENYE